MIDTTQSIIYRMVNRIKFVKMHGLGNDFIIVDARDLPNAYDLPNLVKCIADRHTGMGCDQFVIYNKCDGYYDMVIHNIDGSRAKLCGNAARCLAKLLYINSGAQSVILQVENKKLSCHILAQEEVSVDMGHASFDEDWMPHNEKIWQLAERYTIDLKEVMCVDVGNPHLVIFSKLSDLDQKTIGEKFQDRRLFVDGVNVNFVEIKDNKISLSVWERGAGLTLACGSGACASFAASLKFGFVCSPAEVLFKLGSIKMSKQGDRIIMVGPAALVAGGEFYYE